jgi:hypothetical protein
LDRFASDNATEVLLQEVGGEPMPKWVAIVQAHTAHPKKRA